MKYRIWNKSLNKFVKPDEWYINGDGEVFFHDMMDGDLVPVKNDICVVQRCSEVMDKNGKEIWEGDIVTYIGGYDYNRGKHCKSEVTFRRGEFTPVPNLATTWGTSIDSKSFEVIGNIFENL